MDIAAIEIWQDKLVSTTVTLMTMTVKNMVYRCVLAGNEVIDNPKQSAGFADEWYGKECGHAENDVDENTRCYCRGKYRMDEEWMECPICQKANTNKDKRRNSEEVQLLHTAEEDETEVEVDRESTGSRKIGVPTIDEIELKEVPVYMICPKCGEKGVTRTTVERSKEAECVSLCLCLLQ
eukprot:gene6128-11518_t